MTNVICFMTTIQHDNKLKIKNRVFIKHLTIILRSFLDFGYSIMTETLLFSVFYSEKWYLRLLQTCLVNIHPDVDKWKGRGQLHMQINMIADNRSLGREDLSWQKHN
jgi:hypothetical protein